MARKSSKSSTVSVNFKGIEGRGARTKPGEYPGEVEEVSKEKGDKGDYLAWVFLLGDDGESGKAYFNTSLTKQALWNLRGLLEAMGEDVPDDEMDIDLKEMVGKKVGCVIELEEYNGKTRPKMVDYYPLDGDSKDSEGDDGDDGLDEMDREELEKFIKKKKLDIDADDFKKDKKLVAAIREAIEGDDKEEEDDKKDKKKDKKKKKKGEEKVDKDEVEGMDQEELADLIQKLELETDLDDHKSLRKMVKAVIEELESKDLIAE